MILNTKDNNRRNGFLKSLDMFTDDLMSDEGMQGS